MNAKSGREQKGIPFGVQLNDKNLITSVDFYNVANKLEEKLFISIDENKLKIDELDLLCVVQDQSISLSADNKNELSMFEKYCIKKIEIDYFKGKIELNDIEKRQADTSFVKPFVRKNYSKYQPSTSTRDLNDFSEAIKVLSFEERLNFVFRLLFGREVVVIEDEVVIIESYNPEEKFNTLFPYNKDIGIKILLRDLNYSKVLVKGRKNTELTKKD